jgi:hypothetical protein
MADGYDVAHEGGGGAQGEQHQHQHHQQHAAAANANAAAIVAATIAPRPTPSTPPCPRCFEPLDDEVLEVDGFLACPACGFVIDDSILVHTLFAPGTEDEGGGEHHNAAAAVPLGVRVWHDDPSGHAALSREFRAGGRAGGGVGASAAVGREASYAAGREMRRRRLHARLRAVMAALPGAASLPRRAVGDNAAALLERVDAAYHPQLGGGGGTGGGSEDGTDNTTRHAMRAETLAAVAYVTAREAGAPITFAGAAGAAACAPLALAREFLRLKTALRLTVPQAPLSTLVLTQGAALLRIARRGRGPVAGGLGPVVGGAASAAGATAGGTTTNNLPLPSLLLLPPPPLRSAAGGLATRDRPSAVIAAASLAASNRDLALERAGRDGGPISSSSALPPPPPLPATGARRVAAHPAVASALHLAELLQALGVAETRRRDAVAAACLKLCIGSTPPKRGHAPLRKLSVAEVAAALGVSSKAIGGAVRAAQSELRRMVPLLPFPVRFSDAGAHAGLLLRLHRLACKAQPPPVAAAPVVPALATTEEEGA